MKTPAPISIAESVDRRLPVEAAPLAECAKCGAELVRVGLRLCCETCGHVVGEIDGEAA